MTKALPMLPDGVVAAGGILDRIVEAKIRRLDGARRRVPVSQMAAAAEILVSSRKPESLAAALTTDRVNIIAEIKQRSPSKGVIREEFQPVTIGKSYEEGGAAAVSVLTEEDFFGGSLDDLKAVRTNIELPLLRKDFIFDTYQLYESVLARADAVLLIVAILEDTLLASLLGLARDLRLDALVEVHSGFEMERAKRARASIIGVNNRDLTTFDVDLLTSISLAPLAPKDAVLVSESGINSGADISKLRASGFSAVLVGEHLMRAREPGDALRQLIDEAES